MIVRVWGVIEIMRRVENLETAVARLEQAVRILKGQPKRTPPKSGGRRGRT